MDKHKCYCWGFTGGGGSEYAKALSDARISLACRNGKAYVG